jgi:tRNA G37 N-methylase Trm5
MQGLDILLFHSLVHGHARHVYACEWNPDSMKALCRNLQVNHVDEDRYTLLLGDNQLVCSRYDRDLFNKINWYSKMLLI